MSSRFAVPEWRPTYRLGGYAEFAAPEDLREVVDCIWLYESPEDDAAHRVLPDLNVSVALYCTRGANGAITDAEVTYTGPTDEVRVFRPQRRQHIEAIRLKPEWSRQLLGIDPAEHYNTRPALAAAAASLAARVEPLLLQTTSSRDAIGILLQALRDLRPRVHGRDAAIAHAALERIRATGSRVAAVADDLGVSDRHLRRVVREVTGVTPKFFHRVHRVNRAVAAADANAHPDWARIACDTGFTDQSHLVHEVQSLAGFSPVALHSERRAQRVSLPTFETFSYTA